MDDRIMRIEEKVAYLEQNLGELDALIKELFDGLQSVQLKMRRLEQRLQQPSSEPEEDGDDFSS